jgi:hypothetical protein
LQSLLLRIPDVRARRGEQQLPALTSENPWCCGCTVHARFWLTIVIDNFKKALAIKPGVPHRRKSG